jgi:small GTP-binding protein
MVHEEEIQHLEEELQKTKYNKHTQFHIGKLKAKLAKLKDDAIKKSKGKKGEGYSVKKSGDATVLIVGFPSVGKSTLLNKITNADSKVGAYDFTTVDVIPGIMEYNGAKIQVLDIPGIIEGVSEGRGRGREILSVVRSADLILIMADPGKLESVSVIEKELYNTGFRLNRRPPSILINKKTSGGVSVSSTVKLTKINRELVRSVLQEFKVAHADVIIREDISVDDLIDSLMKNRVYVPYIKVMNKIDKLPEDEVRKLKQSGWLVISAEREMNLELVRKMIWDKLSLMRVYMKRMGKDPDMEQPMIIRKNATVKEVASKIHREAFGERVEYARIWGRSAKFPGQKVGVDKVLQDGDVVELHIA